MKDSTVRKHARLHIAVEIGWQLAADRLEPGRCEDSGKESDSNWSLSDSCRTTRVTYRIYTVFRRTYVRRQMGSFSKAPSVQSSILPAFSAPGIVKTIFPSTSSLTESTACCPHRSTNLWRSSISVCLRRKPTRSSLPRSWRRRLRTRRQLDTPR